MSIVAELATLPLHRDDIYWILKKMNVENLFSNIPESFPKEIFETLLENNCFKLEQIISFGQSTPENDWFDQEKDEWVLLLKGKAGLRFENESEIIELTPGDHLVIPAHKKHRVEWTDKKQKTVWLALHY